MPKTDNMNDRQNSCQRGSVLIGLIVTITIMAFLGAGMVYLTTTSTFQELFANNHVRAHYAAESGGRHAVALARQALATGTPDIATLPATYFSSEYTMANSDKFQVTNWNAGGASLIITFDVIGTTGSGFMKAQRKLSYRINPANQMGAGTPQPPPALPLEASDFDIPKQDLDIYYSPVDMSEVDIKDNPKVDGDNALNLKSDDYTMGLRWHNLLSLAQLDAIRASNSNLLSYGVQVKIKDIDVDAQNPGPYSMVGISFRLDDRNDAVLSDDIDNMYGISFVKLKKPGSLPNKPDWYKNYIHTNPDWDFFSVTHADYWFVVLWKRIFSGTTPTYTPLAYHKISEGDSVCRAGNAGGCTKIQYWATLMVYVEEKSSGSNEIHGYLSQPPTYERSTAAAQLPILWAHKEGAPDPLTVPSIFKPITWTLGPGAGASKTSTSVTGITDPIDIIQDSSLTTENYDNYTIGDTTQTKAREIGLHIFNESTSAQNIFYDNFYIDLSPSGTGGGGGYDDGTGVVDIGG